MSREILTADCVLQNVGTTTRSSPRPSSSSAESTWTACPAVEWWGWQLVDYLLSTDLHMSGWRETCSHLVPLEPRVHNQVGAAGAPETHAAQGEHEAQPAPWGLYLLDDKRGFKTVMSWNTSLIFIVLICTEPSPFYSFFGVSDKVIKSKVFVFTEIFQLQPSPSSLELRPRSVIR